jgi:hypothetical protein
MAMLREASPFSVFSHPGAAYALLSGYMRSKYPKVASLSACKQRSLAFFCRVSKEIALLEVLLVAA